MSRTKVIILGAAGRDFHNFNCVYRGNENYEVVAFTATQIEGIDDRVYPPELAGQAYPRGVPIHPEERLRELIVAASIADVVIIETVLEPGHVISMEPMLTIPDGRPGAGGSLFGWRKGLFHQIQPLCVQGLENRGARPNLVPPGSAGTIPARSQPISEVRP